MFWKIILSSIICSYLEQFWAQAWKKKIKKIHPKKSSVYFEKWNFLALILIFFIFSHILINGNPEKNHCISGNRNLKRASYISGNWTFQPKLEKKSYTSGNGGPEKVSYIFSKENCSYISGKENPPKNSLYFRKRNFLTFQETDTLKNLYISGSNFPSS